jgi:hypothetical protein
MFALSRHDRSADSGPGGRKFLAPGARPGPVPRRRPGSVIFRYLFAALVAPALLLAVSPAIASAATHASHTIKSAQKLTVGKLEHGGGGPIDFWKVTLNGGDIVQFNATTPAQTQYEFELLPPGTNDNNVQTAVSFSAAGSNLSGRTVFDLQAPYNGTFILAVCQGPGVDNFTCASVYTGGAVNPMADYSFSTSFAKSVPPKVAAAETQASPHDRPRQDDGDQAL